MSLTEPYLLDSCSHMGRRGENRSPRIALGGSRTGKGDEGLSHAQQQLEAAHNVTLDEWSAVRRESLWRRAVAYGLSSVAVLGGLAIALALFPSAARAVGAIVAVAVVAERLTANQKRLLLTTKAHYAYRRLNHAVIVDHDAALDEMPEEPGARAKHSMRACQSARKQLDAGRDRIRTALEDGDLKLLQSLAMEKQLEVISAKAADVAPALPPVEPQPPQTDPTE